MNKISKRIAMFCLIIFVFFVTMSILHVYPGLWGNRGDALAVEERSRQEMIRREMRLLRRANIILPNDNFVEVKIEIRELIKNAHKEENGVVYFDFRFSPSFFELKERSNEVRAVALELFKNGDLNCLEELILLIVLHPEHERWRKIAW